jgi:hypothetical protein
MRRTFSITLTALSLVFSIFSTSAAKAAEGTIPERPWARSSVKASGVEISLDYRVYSESFRESYKVYAGDAYLSIRKDGLDGNQRVRAVLLTLDRANGKLVQSLVFDLEAVEPNLYSAKVPSNVALFQNIKNEGQVYRHEVAIVIDGIWLKASSGSSNFDLDIKE